MIYQISDRQTLARSFIGHQANLVYLTDELLIDLHTIAIGARNMTRDSS